MPLSSAYGRPRPTGGLELRSWLFMRVSGLILQFLALGHLALMHLINTVDEIDYTFVANRYAYAGWRLYDLAMLVLAMIHGTNGVRIIIDDYLKGRARSAAVATLYLLCGSLLILGTGVALFFQPMGH